MGETMDERMGETMGETLVRRPETILGGATYGNDDGDGEMV